MPLSASLLTHVHDFIRFLEEVSYLDEVNLLVVNPDAILISLFKVHA